MLKRPNFVLMDGKHSVIDILTALKGARMLALGYQRTSVDI